MMTVNQIDLFFHKELIAKFPIFKLFDNIFYKWLYLLSVIVVVHVNLICGTSIAYHCMIGLSVQIGVMESVYLDRN